MRISDSETHVSGFFSRLLVLGGTLSDRVAVEWDEGADIWESGMIGTGAGWIELLRLYSNSSEVSGKEHDSA